MKEIYEEESWQGIYKAMGCNLPYCDEEEFDICTDCDDIESCSLSWDNISEIQSILDISSISSITVVADIFAPELVSLSFGR